MQSGRLLLIHAIIAADFVQHVVALSLSQPIVMFAHLESMAIITTANQIATVTSTRM